MSKDDYEVGYKKPPKNNQFKKGQSGNPKGRPIGSESTLTIAERVLSETIIVREGSIQKEVNKTEAMLLRLTQKAIKGDIKAAERMLKISEKIDKKNDKYEEIIDYIHSTISKSLRRARKDPDVLAMLNKALRDL